MRSRLLLAAALLAALAGCAGPPAPPPPAAAAGPACQAPARAATEVNLFFGRNRPDGGRVGDAEWRSFVEEVLIPAFPDGMTVVTAVGRSADSAPGLAGDETSMLAILLVFEQGDLHARIDRVSAAYRERFRQQAVLATAKPACAEFFQRL